MKTLKIVFFCSICCFVLDSCSDDNVPEVTDVKCLLAETWSSQKLAYINEKFTYDSANRLIKSVSKINFENPVITTFEYLDGRIDLVDDGITQSKFIYTDDGIIPNQIDLKTATRDRGYYKLAYSDGNITMAERHWYNVDNEDITVYIVSVSYNENKNVTAAKIERNRNDSAGTMYLDLELKNAVHSQGRNPFVDNMPIHFLKGFYPFSYGQYSITGGELFSGEFQIEDYKMMYDYDDYDNPLKANYQDSSRLETFSYECR
ncbi:MAG: hypothetical protein ACI80H_001298 [Pseudoalteromonas distincta]|jgi:hypothetical protein